MMKAKPPISIPKVAGIPIDHVIIGFKRSTSVLELETRWRAVSRHVDELKEKGLKRKIHFGRVSNYMHIAVNQTNNADAIKVINKGIGAVNLMKLRFKDDKTTRQCLNTETELHFLRLIYTEKEVPFQPLNWYICRLRLRGKRLLKSPPVVFKLFEAFVLKQPLIEIKKQNLNFLFLHLAIQTQIDTCFALYDHLDDPNLQFLTVEDHKPLVQHISFCLVQAYRRSLRYEDLNEDEFPEKFAFFVSNGNHLKINTRALSNLLGYIFVSRSRNRYYLDDLSDLLVHKGREILSNHNAEAANSNDCFKLIKGYHILLTESDQLNTAEIEDFLESFRLALKLYLDSDNCDNYTQKKAYDCIILLANELERDEVVKLVFELLKKSSNKGYDDEEEITPSLAIKALLLVKAEDKAIQALKEYKNTQNLYSVHHLLDYFLSKEKGYKQVRDLGMTMQNLGIKPKNITVDKIFESFVKESIDNKQRKEQIVSEGLGTVLSMLQLNGLKINKITLDRVKYITDVYKMPEAHAQFLNDLNQNNNDEFL